MAGLSVDHLRGQARLALLLPKPLLVPNMILRKKFASVAERQTAVLYEEATTIARDSPSDGPRLSLGVMGETEMLSRKNS
jgi:hypothetical protein